MCLRAEMRDQGLMSCSLQQLFPPKLRPIPTVWMELVFSDNFQGPLYLYQNMFDHPPELAEVPTVTCVVYFIASTCLPTSGLQPLLQPPTFNLITS